MADGKFGLKGGAEYAAKKNLEPGMNDDLAYADRAGYNTSFENMNGIAEDWYCFSGPEVGNAYDLDPMGEQRSMITFDKSEPLAHGFIGTSGAEGGAGKQEGAAETTTVPGGKTTKLAPQNYNSVGKIAKE